jgi:cytidylate kinase
MLATHLSNQPAQSLLNVVNHWEERRQAQTQPSTVAAFAIAISREAETGGTAVAREVGDRLGWRVYDRELLQQIAADLGVRAELLDNVDEHRGNWLREAFERMLGVPYVPESAYVHRLVKIVQTIGALGDCVIVGRGAPFVLPAATTFRVRLVAPRDHRVASLRSRLGLDESSAESMLTTQDRERIGFVRDHFSKDPEEPSQYDLTLNVARFSAGECADIIVDGLRLWRKGQA